MNKVLKISIGNSSPEKIVLSMQRLQTKTMKDNSRSNNESSQESFKDSPDQTSELNERTEEASWMRCEMSLGPQEQDHLL